MKRIIFLLSIVILIIFTSCKSNSKFIVSKNNRPKIAFTFDDPVTLSFAGYENEVWNEMILKTLKSENIQAGLFVCGMRIDSEKGKKVLQSWNNDNHLICNHTYNHPYYHSNKISLDNFKLELLKTDSIIKNYSNYTKLFRFPYLKEGNSPGKIEGFRTFMKNNDYKNGYVSIDASDWYICNRLLDTLKANPKKNIDGFKKYYIEHIYDRALYYDSLATQLTNRKINHNLLLHHNLTSALFLKDLITHFKSKGWKIIGAKTAFEDPIYSSEPKINPAGESIIWSLAKETGKFESILRYPGEDGEYEAEKMNKLGL